ncbi:uncharacterized protein YjbJ (UPF0337 family) [Arenibacter sp. ARW7G5Y1]|nr:uncharacterized protein YjbJ (UPF0337 family) [Arenibacter sp. ARW7G5Y1]|tara:strand:+ start:11227 stop:11529 length:303 start_codon:yes stop_codon:yes gene_type:complete
MDQKWNLLNYRLLVFRSNFKQDKLLTCLPISADLKINKTMNSDQLEGKWKQVKGKFKQKYGDLTDNDLTYSEGKFDEFLGRLQEKTGKAKEQLKEEIDNM